MGIFTRLAKGIFDYSADESQEKTDNKHDDETVLQKQNSAGEKFGKNFDPVEASWEFLVNITEVILNKFSEEQQHKLLDIGRSLHRTGAVYNHVIYNAERIKEKGKVK